MKIFTSRLQTIKGIARKGEVHLNITALGDVVLSEEDCKNFKNLLSALATEAANQKFLKGE